MSRFLERQLKHAEDKPLGRQSWWSGRVEDASTRPPNVVKHAIPADRSRGVVKPGSEVREGSDGPLELPVPRFR